MEVIRLFFNCMLLLYYNFNKQMKHLLYDYFVAVSQVRQVEQLALLRDYDATRE